MRIEFEWSYPDPRVAELMKHFGATYVNESAMFKDMIDDVIDVWWDEHLSHGGLEDPCTQ